MSTVTDNVEVRKITQSKIKTLINELNVHVNEINKQIMRALKIKLYPHTYRDTSEIQHYAINK